MASPYINGSHRNNQPGYFEWWYFHFVDESGDTFNIVLHETDIFGIDKTPYVSMSILPRGEKPLYFRREIGLGIITTGSLYLDAGSLINESSETIEISIEFAQSTSVHLTVEKTFPPLALNEGVLYQIDQGHQSNWLVEAARASYRGVLTIKGKRHSIQGIAYHDHQWGSVPIQHFVSDWIWGHFSDEIQTHIFFYISSKGGQTIKRYIQTQSERVATSLSVESPHLWMLSQMENPEVSTSSAFVKVRDTDPLLSFTIQPERLIRVRIDENHDTFLSTYLRWEADAVYGNDTLVGITEYLRIR